MTDYTSNELNDNGKDNILCFINDSLEVKQFLLVNESSGVQKLKEIETRTELAGADVLDSD